MSESNFTLRVLTQADAEAIAAWRYPAPYDLYNHDAIPTIEVVASFLDPSLHYYGVFDSSSRLVAFRCFGPDAQVIGGDYSLEALDMGGGLRPDLTGRGMGQSVLGVAMSFAKLKFSPTLFRTTVASFNQRALTVCQKLGYRAKLEFSRTTDHRRFTILIREA